MGTNQELNNRSKASAAKAKQLPASTQYAIVKVLPNIVNGAFWGFDSVKSVMEHKDALLKDQNIILRKLADSCLIEINPSYMLQAVQIIDSNALTQSDINNIQSAQGQAHLEFERFLIKNAKKGAFGGTIGIYCINDTASIKYKGASYPAFRLSMNDVLAYLGNYNYSIKVNGNFVSPKDAFCAGQPLWDSVVLSPTKTGLFIDIKYEGTKEQGKAFETAFKQKYNNK